MIESKMQLAFQCQCYDYGVDRAEKCVDKVSCEILYALSSKSFDTAKSTFIVMLQKWLCDFKLDNYAGIRNLCLKTSQHQPQVQQTAYVSNSFSLVNHRKTNIQMDRNVIFHSNGGGLSQNYQTVGGTFAVPSIDNSRFSNSIKDQSPCVWSKNATVPHQMIHNQLLCNKHYVKRHRIDLNGVAENIMHTQRYNLSSTKLANNTSTIGADHDNGCVGEPFDSTTAAANHKQENAPNNNNNNNNRSGKCTPPAAKPSLKKIVQRSPLTIVHRANLLQIFIKYLLILNCFMCFANGNLMSRNIGNDLSSKHNQSQSEAATAALNSSTLIGSNRKGILSTTSPLIPHSVLSNNNRSQFQSPSIHSQDSERAKHFLHQHAQDALISNSYVSDEPASPYKTPNGEDSGSEEFTRCTSCQFREQLKAHNLASIKMHILARLSMTHPPNITGRPHISEQILQTFYENVDFRYIRVRNDTPDELNEMQGDDPNPASGQHQHHHLHEYHRNGGIKTGLNEQHHHHHNRHLRIENEYNEEYDYSDDGGIVYNTDYYEKPRSSTRMHFDDVPPYDNVEETDDAFYSMTDVIYSFPKLSKARHRGDILEFTIKNNNHLSVSGATFNLFVRGEDWISENEPNVWMRTNGGLNNARSNTDGMHIDDSMTGSSTVSATSRDEQQQHNLATSSETFHKLHGNGKNVNNNHISISINRFVHRHQQQQSTNDQEQSKKSAQPTQQQQQQQRYTRIDSNFVGEIPKGAGEWIQFNITLMVSEWIEQQKHQSVNTQSADIVQEVVIKTLEPSWMRQLLVLDTNSKNRPYIEIQTRDMRKHRTKRHLARDCRENDRQSRCCRYPLRVDFRKFGWDWIIAPDIYEAYYCAGECPIGFLPKHPHTYIYSLSSSYSTCCSPRKLSPLSLLYFDDNKNVIHSIIPNMAVEKCGCS